MTIESVSSDKPPAQTPRTTFFTDSTTQRSGGPIVGVQALRGLAALLVVFHHYNGTAQSHGFGFSAFQGTVIGNIGVDIFFVISGFIMELTVKEKHSRQASAGDFLARRAIRVLPLYWLLTTVAFATSLFFSSSINRAVGIREFLLSMLLLPATSASGEGSYVIGVAWSLTYEMYFYLLFAALLACGARSGFRVAALFVWFGMSAVLGLFIRSRPPLLNMVVDPILFEFLMGCVLAYLFKKRVRIDNKVAVLLIAGAVTCMIFEADFPVTNDVRLMYWGVPASLLVYGVVLAKNWRQVGGIARPFVFLGDLSYSIYLSHFFSIAIFVRIYGRLMTRNTSGPLMLAVLCFAFCVVAASFCYFIFERSSRIWLSHWWRPQTQHKLARQSPPD